MSGRWVIRASKDHEEAPLLSRAAGNPRDRAVRAEYRALLAARGDTRARLFELAEALDDARADASAIAAQIEALLADDDLREWWNVASGMAPIRNCGHAKDLWVKERFTFVCPRSWASLARTQDENVRACDGCGELVHFCADDDALRAHAQDGHCVAMPAAAEENAVECARNAHGSTIAGRPKSLDYLAIYALSAK